MRDRPLTLIFTVIATFALMATAGSVSATVNPPTGLTAYGGNAQALLSWNASAGAASYNVYRSTTSGSGYARVNASPVSATSYTDNGVSNGTNYYYVVTATDGVESGFSQEVGVLPNGWPAGFGTAQVAAGLVSPAQLDITPDGRLFVAQQDGVIRVIKNDQLLAAPFASLPVDDGGERGLLGITFDPGFATNQYVYVFYTAASPTSHNRLSRLTASGDLVVTNSEVALADFPDIGTAVWHMGGAIQFGPDGKIYIAVGQHQDHAAPQSLSDPGGKILRFNSDGTIPVDNPFYNQTTGLNRAIWALGLRNPYTTAFQPGTGRFFINDVGEASWEEIDEGSAGANYGWPATEGDFNQATFPNYTRPVYVYSHGEGCAVTGGTFYNPATNQFPAQYVGKYFFQDFCNGWIRTLDPANYTVASFGQGGPYPTDIRTSPDGSLYYLSRGAATGGLASGLGKVFKIQYLVNTPPTITLQPQSQLVSVGYPATFTVSAAGSQPLSYQWQSNAVNIAGAVAPDYTLASAQLTDNGAAFRCIVSNAFGTAISSNAVLSVTTNQPPVPTISAPIAGTKYDAGDTINFAGSATDAEDGAIAASNLTWQIDFHHETHAHPFLAATNGFTNGSFVIPTTGEKDPVVWYRLYLTAKDSIGLTTIIHRDVTPNLTVIMLGTSPTGLSISLDAIPTATPSIVTGVVNMVRTLQAPSVQLNGGQTYVFDHWSDGGAAAHDINFPAVNTTYTAVYLQTNSFAFSNWKFDEGFGTSVADSGPAGNNGTISGDATWVSGKSGTALSFDGLGDDYVFVSQDLNQAMGGTASLTCWIKTTQTGNTTMFLAPGITGVESAGNGNDVFWGWLDATGRIGITAGNGAAAKSTNPVNNGQWHHIGLTRNSTNGQVKVYIDGILNSTVTSETGTKTTPFHSIGRIEDTAGTPVYFAGAIDELRLYDRVLSAAEIEASTNTTPVIDGDGDGLPDAWEIQYFGSTNAPNGGATMDADGDGMNNSAESQTGTDPTNNVSAFRITAVARENNNVRVTWSMGPGKTNALQWATGDPSGDYSNNFADVFTATNTVGSATNYLDVGATTNFPSRFYRVRLVP